MTMQALPTERVDLSAVGAAIVPLLPAEHALTVRTESSGSWLPGRGCRAVSASPLDGSCTITLVVSDLIAAAVELGADGIRPLELALAPVLQAALDAFGFAAHDHGAFAIADPALAARATIGLSVYDDDTHAASLVVELTVAPPPAAPAAPVSPVQFDTVDPQEREHVSHRPIEFLSDVELAVTAELGRTKMTVRELLRLGSGSVVELDRAAGSHVDLLVNGRLIARGEVVVVDDEFGVRISEVVARDRGLGGSV